MNTEMIKQTLEEYPKKNLIEKQEYLVKQSNKEFNIEVLNSNSDMRGRY